MIPAAERASASVVILGAFTPRMFHPIWFKSMGLLGETEVDHTAKDKSLAIVDELARFDVGAFEFFIARDRFQITTQREDYFAPLRDLMIGSLSALDHSPAKAMGLNWNIHFPTPSENAWHAVGDKLVPKSLWREIWTKHVGMQNLQVRMERDDSFTGNVNVTVQPSSVVRFGVYVDINDHHEFAADFTLAKVAEVLQTTWDASRIRATALFAGLYSRVTPNAG